MALLYRGAGPGSHSHVHDAREFGFAPHSPGQPENPGYVYEIEVPNGKECMLLDPVKEIAKSLPCPWQDPNYHHDGEPTFLLGVVDPLNMQACLQIQCLFPPLSAGTPRTPYLSEQLKGMVRALRDAEILVKGKVPKALVRCRYEVV
jgi:hypothetical protein